MSARIELEGLHELRAALLEERRNIVASVAELRDTRRRKGTFVLGDGSSAGPRIVAIQQQIEAVEAIIADLIGAEGGEGVAAQRANGAERHRDGMPQ